MLQDLNILEVIEGETLFKKGDEGIYFYVIKLGELEVSLAEGGTKKLYKGDMFGELSLLQRKNRTGTVKASSTCTLYCLKGETFRKIQQDSNQTSLRENLNFLHLVPIFSCLDNHQLHSIVSSMKQYKCNSGMSIIKEGEEGDRLYIIKKGTVAVTENGKNIRKMGKNDFFGELSVLFSQKRTVSIVSSSKCYLIEISTESLIEALGVNFKDILLLEMTKRALSEDQLARCFLTHDYLNTIYSLFNESNYSSNSTVIDGSTLEKKLIIVIEGSLSVNRRLEEKEIASKGQVYCNFLSEDALFGGEIETVKAKENSYILEVTLEEIVKKLEIEELTNFLMKLKMAAKLKSADSFKDLSDDKISKLVDLMKEEPKLKEGEIVFKEGSEGDKFYFVVKGAVEISSNGKFMRKMEENHFFGEMALILDPVRSATVTASSDLVLFSLNKADFLSLIDKEHLDILKARLSLQDTFSTKLEDFYMIKSLGEGKFGSVRLVHNKKNLYAIKCVPISAVDKQKILAEYFVRERNIMLSLDHSFMITLVKTLRDDNYLFYLMEYVNGIVMSRFLESRPDENLRDKFQVRFYIAILLIVIDYLNKQKIAHRDLKPDNIMVDERGYLKLIDFGTAKVIKDFTVTVTGTPHYIAPEVLQGRGYGLSVDYWSIGVIAFEIYFDSHPFGPRAREPMEVYKETLKKFPFN